MGKFYQGKYKPKNPGKYRGDVNNIVYRSSWELKFLNYLDRNQNVLEYASEEFFIPYLSPIPDKHGKKRIRRYFPDFWVKLLLPDGNKEVRIIEVKPYSQTRPPKPTKSGRVTKRVINEAATYEINKAKWKAAEEFCLDNGYKFVIMTENELGIK